MGEKPKIVRKCRICGKLYTEDELKSDDGKLRCPNCGSDLFNIVRAKSYIQATMKEEEKKSRIEIKTPKEEALKALEEISLDFWPTKKDKRRYLLGGS